MKTEICRSNRQIDEWRRDGCSRESGFTLVELMVTVMILGILFSIVGVTVFKRIDETKWKTTVIQIRTLESALESYRLDMGDYPSSDQGLQALRGAPDGVDGWFGPYLNKAVPTDKWGRPYIYRFPGEETDGYEIISYGKDGNPGGDMWNKDIFSWM